MVNADDISNQLNIRSGNLAVRLARDAEDLEAIQALRYRIFYREMSATPTPEMKRLERDFDDFDPFCDHLMVIDHGLHKEKGIVGTYRLLRRPGALNAGVFYTSTEYDISKLLAYPGEILELGRSCVDAAYRTRSTMMLLWRGIAFFVFHYNIALMFGCASIPGIDQQSLALPLSYLYFYHLAPPHLRPMALKHRWFDMQLVEPDFINPKHALSVLPPLIKGYLRLGGFVGDGAVIDKLFKTTDVCIVVKTDLVTEKYYHHYERQIENPRSSDTKHV